MIVDEVSYSFSQFVAHRIDEAIREVLSWDVAANLFEGAFGPSASLDEVVPADGGKAGAVAIFGETWQVVHWDIACLANCLD
jgi:hypothetical protein